MRRIEGLVGVALATLASAPCESVAVQGVGPQSGEQSTNPEPELVLFDLVYQRRYLESSLSAYQDAQGIFFVPFRQVVNTLGFRLQLDVTNGRAEGFFFGPSDRVVINFVTGRFWRPSGATRFDLKRALVRDGELYVDAKLLAEWSGARFEWRKAQLVLEVASDRPLPAEALRRRLQNTSAVPAPPREVLKTIRPKYRAWSLPSIDMQLSTAAERGMSATNSVLGLQGAGDLLFMGARYRITAGSRGQRPGAFLNLGRQDAEGRLLGPMRATEFTVGDVGLRPVPLLARGRGGLGVTVGNFPLSDARDLGVSVVSGLAPPGSNVELYRSDKLVDLALAGNDGVYEFRNLSLDPGTNELRIVVVGAEGQIREERRTLYGDGSAPRPGVGRYRLTAVQAGSSLLGLGKGIASKTESGRQYLAEYERGLAPGTWLSTMAAVTDSSTGRAGYVGLGLHRWSGHSLWRLNTIGATSGGYGGVLSMTRRLGMGTFSFEQTYLSKRLQTGRVPDMGPDVSALTRIRFDGGSRAFGFPLVYGLAVDHSIGQETFSLLRARVAGGGPNLFVSSSLRMRVGSGTTETSGTLHLRKPLGRAVGRLDIGYDLQPQRSLKSVRLSMDRTLSRDYRLRLGTDYELGRRSPLEVTGAVYRMLGPFSLGLNMTLGSGGALRASLLLSVGVWNDGSLGSSALTRSGAVDRGSVTARVFLDRNLSGTYDRDDTLLEGIGLTVNGRGFAGKTSRAGTLSLARLAPNQNATISLDEGTFEDPYWISATPGVIVVPRAGSATKLNFAVIAAGEIEGSVTLGDGSVHPNGLITELADGTGKVVATGFVDGDGTFVFSRVRPGSYALRLLDGDRKRLVERSVTVASGETVKGIDLKVDLSGS